jgi:hypothetical protein
VAALSGKIGRKEKKWRLCHWKGFASFARGNAAARVTGFFALWVIVYFGLVVFICSVSPYYGQTFS